MLGKVETVCILLACASFIVLVVPVRATEYIPGVQVGYWVEYGNFAVRGPGDSEDFNATESMKMEVARVLGSRVTVHTSRILKNETFQDGSDYVFDVATNETDRSANSTNLWNNYLVVAGNLTEGSDTHLVLMIPEGFSFRPAAILINKTETRYLFGTYRTINLVDYRYANSTYHYDYRFYAAYDHTTGMLLELNCSLTSQITPDINEEFSYSAAEINTNLGATDYKLVYTGGIVAAIIILGIASTFVFRRKKSARAAEKRISDGKLPKRRLLKALRSRALYSVIHRMAHIREILIRLC